MVNEHTKGLRFVQIIKRFKRFVSNNIGSIADMSFLLTIFIKVRIIVLSLAL